MLLLPLGAEIDANVYDLASAVIHYGHSAESGHYVALIQEKNDLFKISDTVVKGNDRFVFPWNNNDSNKCYYVQ